MQYNNQHSKLPVWLIFTVSETNWSLFFLDRSKLHYWKGCSHRDRFLYHQALPTHSSILQEKKSSVNLKNENGHKSYFNHIWGASVRFKNKAGHTLYFSYRQNIQWKDQNQESISPSLNFSPSLFMAPSCKLIHSYSRHKSLNFLFFLNWPMLKCICWGLFSATD